MTPDLSPQADEALNQVLDALASGDSATVARLGAEYPEAALGFLAAVAAEVEESLLVAATPATRSRHVRLLMQEATTLRAAGTGAGAAPPKTRRSRRRFRILAALGSLVALALLAIPATAALASNAQPGQTLYSTRLLLENVELAAQRNPAKRATLQLKFAEQRMSEVAKLVSSGNTREAAAIAGKLAAQQRALQATLQRLQATGAASPSLLKTLNTAMTRHAARLAGLADLSGCTVHPRTAECTALRGARLNTERVLRRLGATLPTTGSGTPAAAGSPTAGRIKAQGAAGQRKVRR